MLAPIPPNALWLAGAALLLLLAVAGTARRRGPPSLPEGTLFVAALDRSVSTADARTGDAIDLWTVHPVVLPDGHVVPEGTVIHGEVTHVQSGRALHAPELLLRFTAIDVAYDWYAIVSATFVVHGRWEAGGSPPIARSSTGVALDSGATDGRELMLPAGRRLAVRLAAPAGARHRRVWLSRHVD